MQAMFSVSAVLLLATVCCAQSQLSSTTVKDSSFKAFLPVWEEAVTKFVNGDNTLWKQICSRSSDATILGGFGGYEKGWQEVDARYDWAASQFKPGGTKVNLEYISIVAGEALACIVVIERSNPVITNLKKTVSQALRVTQVFRKENGEWKLLHRHADTFLEKKAPASQQ